MAEPPKLTFIARRQKQIYRWYRNFLVEEAYVPDNVRRVCQRYGERIISTMLAGNSSPLSPELQEIYETEATREYARAWLNEEAAYNTRRDHWISLRDFVLEVVIIVLILWEIGMSYRAERHQADNRRDDQKSQSQNFNAQQSVLTNLQSSSSTTASALQSLVTDQTTSLDRLQEMNTSLQNSLKITRGTATTMSKQLDILAQEQNARLAQLAKKPKLALYLGYNPLSCPQILWCIRDQITDTKTTLDLNLSNDGNAEATGISLRVVVGADDVSLESAVPHREAPPSPNLPFKTFLFSIPLVRPFWPIAVPMTLTYPKDHRLFTVTFSVDADQTEYSNVNYFEALGTLTLLPQQQLPGVGVGEHSLCDYCQSGTTLRPQPRHE